MSASLRPEPWTRDSACANHPALPPTAWDGDGTASAQAVCRACPVRAECLGYVLRHAIADGMWAGLTPDERTRLTSFTRHDRPGLPQHGTRARYVHRTQSCRCELCREAHRRWATERRATGAWQRTPQAVTA